jgi:hypothetical protein
MELPEPGADVVLSQGLLVHVRQGYLEMHGPAQTRRGNLGHAPVPIVQRMKGPRQQSRR